MVLQPNPSKGMPSRGKCGMRSFCSTWRFSPGHCLAAKCPRSPRAEHINSRSDAVIGQMNAA
jgi:hypothetical protein